MFSCPTSESVATDSTNHVYSMKYHQKLWRGFPQVYLREEACCVAISSEKKHPFLEGGTESHYLPGPGNSESHKIHKVPPEGYRSNNCEARAKGDSLQWTSQQMWQGAPGIQLPWIAIMVGWMIR